MARTRTPAVVAVARCVTLALALQSPRVAVAAPVGTGTGEQLIGGPCAPNFYCGTLTFDDAPFDVFGVPINLGTALTGQTFSFAGDITGFGSNGGTTSLQGEATDPSVMSFSATGAFICTGSCTDGQPNFTVVDLAPLTGSVIAGLPAGLHYGMDFVGTCVGSSCTHVFSMNAYQPVTTPQSPPDCSGTACNVTTSVEAAFVDPVTGFEVPLAVALTFDSVGTAGDTVVKGRSNVAASIPSGLALEVGGYKATFFDVSTTATVSGPTTVCLAYADADADQIVDGTTVAAESLRLLHKGSTDGAFVDVTSLPVDTANTRVCGTVTSLSPFVVAALSSICGNGATEFGEQCDDGAANGNLGSCCSATCQFEPSSTPCTSDDNLCTTDRCDGSGVCGHLAEPDPDCLIPTVAGKASLKIKNLAGTVAGDAIQFKWGRGPAVAASDFGPAPAAGSPFYELCIYDRNDPVVTQAFRAQAFASADCGGVPCWKATSDIGWKFKSKDGMPDGLTRLLLKSGAAGKAKIQAKGKGTRLTLPTLPLVQTPAVVAQLRTSSGKCWGALFSTHMRNDSLKFVARSD